MFARGGGRAAKHSVMPALSHHWTLNVLNDPKRLAFVLARYAFVARVAGPRRSVLELGCSEGAGAALLAADADEHRLRADVALPARRGRRPPRPTPGRSSARSRWQEVAELHAHRIGERRLAAAGDIARAFHAGAEDLMADLTLYKFAAKMMELVDVERNTIKGGSLIGFAQPSGGPREVSERVARAIEAEARAGYDTPAPYVAFSERLDRLKADVSTLFERVAAEGSGVAGFGAARGGTTLLYRLGIGDEFEFISDDNPSKHGLCTPGHHIPVLPSEALYERRPDYVFILAWAHSKAIRRDHERYIDEGGRFIVAYPEVEVVSARSG